MKYILLLLALCVSAPAHGMGMRTRRFLAEFDLSADFMKDIALSQIRYHSGSLPSCDFDLWLVSPFCSEVL